MKERAMLIQLQCAVMNDLIYKNICKTAKKPPGGKKLTVTREVETATQQRKMEPDSEIF